MKRPSSSDRGSLRGGLAGPIALALAVALVRPTHAAEAPSLAVGNAPRPAPTSFFQRSDVAFVLASGVAVWATSRQDLWLASEGIESNTRLDRGVADAVRPLGDPAIVLPVLLAAYGVVRWSHARGTTAGFVEVGTSVLAAGAAALVLKEAVGRDRPEDSPGDPYSFRPFSGRTSFPSGHASVAFALAQSVNQVSAVPWAPWVTYPAAALVGWSRVRDDRHWTSDVVAGAALGVWTARKVHRMRPGGRSSFAGLDLGLGACGGSPGVFVTLRQGGH